MKNFFWFMVTMIVVHYGLFALGAGEQIQIQLTPWEWFNAQPDAVQRKTIWLILAPGAASVLVSIVLMSSLIKIYGFNDKVRLPLAMFVSGAIGSGMIYFVMNPINTALNYEIFDQKMVLGAFFLTALANHVAFKIITWALLLVYLLSQAVPANFAILGYNIGWIGHPLSTFAKAVYRMLTVKDVADKKKPSDPEDESDEGVITDLMATKVVDPDTTPTPEK